MFTPVGRSSDQFCAPELCPCKLCCPLQPKASPLRFTIPMASASLLDYRGTSLYAEDVNTLSPGQWLNDQVIAFAMDFISEEVVPSTRKVALCHPG